MSNTFQNEIAIIENLVIIIAIDFIIDTRLA